MRPTSLDGIYIPKFKVDFHAELTKFLQTLGIRELFDSRCRHRCRADLLRSGSGHQGVVRSYLNNDCTHTSHTRTVQLMAKIGMKRSQDKIFCKGAIRRRFSLALSHKIVLFKNRWLVIPFVQD